MKPNIICASGSFRAEHQSRPSTGCTEGDLATGRRNRGTTAGSSAPVNPDLPNAPIAFLGRHQSTSESERRPAIKGEISWGLLAAFSAVLASAGMLLAIASTGSIYLD